MDAKEFVDSLFTGYEETAALADFKEELLANLNAKIESLVKKGMDDRDAFTKASAELGDVSALADELSLKKRKEVFEEVYMDIRNFMNTKRVAGYVAFGVSALFGILVAFIVLFSRSKADMSGVFGSMLPFITAAAAGFTWLGLTQETSSMYPLSGKRAAWYAAAAGLIAFGILAMPVVYFSVKSDRSGYEMLTVVSMIIPFILPGIGMLVFLVLTEKDRLKPWAKNFRENAVKHEMELWNNPAAAARFGMFSGAIWIFAVGLFLLLGFVIGFKYSWLVFIFAIAFQLLIQGRMSKA